MLVFGKRENLEKPGKNPLEKSREPTNLIHVWQQVQESNTGHIFRIARCMKDWIVFICSNGFVTGPRYELTNHYIPITCYFINLEEIRSSMAILETFFHGTKNIASPVSSCLKLKFKLNFWVRTPLPTPWDVCWGVNYAAVISSIPLSKEAWAINVVFFGSALLCIKRCYNTLSSRITRVE